MIKSLSLDTIKTPNFYYKTTNYTDKQKLFNSIKRWGIARNIIVRKCKDFYEIVEGRFIFDCAKQLNTIYIQALDLGEISEREAKLANLALNFTHSYEDHASIAFDIAALCEEFSINELCQVIPYTPEQIQRFKEISEFSWDGFKKQYALDQVGMFDVEEVNIENSVTDTNGDLALNTAHVHSVVGTVSETIEEEIIDDKEKSKLTTEDKERANEDNVPLIEPIIPKEESLSCNANTEPPQTEIIENKPVEPSSFKKVQDLFSDL